MSTRRPADARRSHRFRTHAGHVITPANDKIITQDEVLEELHINLQGAKEDRESKEPVSQNVRRWRLQYLTGLIGVSTLGASITFGVFATTKESDQVPGRFSEGAIRTFLAVAYLLFLTTLGTANLLFALLSFHEKNFFANDEVFKSRIGRNHGPRFYSSMHWFNLFITSCVLTAFVMLALVIVTYSEAVGWITLVFIGLYSVVVGWLWVLQLGDD